MAVGTIQGVSIDDSIITLDDLHKLKEKMRALKKGWLEELAVRMHKDNPSINKSKVYNILHNVVRHQEYRILFVLHAIAIIREAAKRQLHAIEVLNGAPLPADNSVADIGVEEPKDEFLDKFTAKLKKIKGE